MKIGVIVSSIREERNGKHVADWVLDYAKKYTQDATFELIDLKEYQLPLLGKNPTKDELDALIKWQTVHANMDGFILVLAEYNHSIPGVFKNASDFLRKELNNKALAYVGYGGLGAARAIEQHRIIAAEQSLATTQRTVNFSLFTDFVAGEFKPNLAVHQANMNEMLDQLLAWTKALKTIR